MLSALLASTLSVFRTRAALQLEIIALRHQLGVLQRSVKRPKLNRFDRFLWAWFVSLERMALSSAHRQTGHRHRVAPQGISPVFGPGKFAAAHAGDRQLSEEIRKLIRKMSRDNPLWGAPRIHRELLKLGIDVSATSVSKHMVHRRNPPSQTWRTFLENHVKTTVSIDFFTVPTIRFQVLYVFLGSAHDRRRIVHFNVPVRPTAEWTGQQLREAFPFEEVPRYLLRDRDSIFGADFTKEVGHLGIEEVPSTPRSPWQRAYIERVIGSIRRECIDHVIVFNEESLRRHMKSYVQYYHETRTHLALEKDTAASRSVHPPELGQVVALPQVGGLHHRYERRAAG